MRTAKLDPADILTSVIDPNPGNPRKDFPIEDLRDLGESMKSLGQWVPIILRKTGERYMLVDGERRWRAAQLALILKLSAIIVDHTTTDSEINAIILVTTLHKADLKPYELYLGCMEWFKATPGGTAKELAAMLKRDASAISKICSLKDCIQVVQEAAAGGRLGVTPWNEISKNPADVQHTMLVDYLNNGSTRDGLKKTRQARNGLGKGEGLSKLKIPYDGGEVIVTGKDLGLVELVDTLERLLKDARKAIGKIEIRTFISMRRDQLKAGAS